MSQTDVRNSLSELHLPIKRHGNWPAITVPDLDSLNDKLIKFNVNTELLEPWKAHVTFRRIKSLDGFHENQDGRFRFDVQFYVYGNMEPSSVCCHDLNVSARAHVSAFDISLRCVFDDVTLSMVGDQAFRNWTIPPITWIRDLWQWIALTLTIAPVYQLRFADGWVSDVLLFDQLDHFAKILLDTKPTTSSRNRPGKKRDAISQRTDSKWTSSWPWRRRRTNGQSLRACCWKRNSRVRSTSGSIPTMSHGTRSVV